MKVQLTQQEVFFLAHHGINPNDVYDARGQSGWYWKEQIRKEGKTLALGTECSRGGHRLRTRAGHCVQCDPKKLSFQRRFHAVGWVYIAGSLSGRLIKIGICEDYHQRLRQICAEGYGGCRDWHMLYLVRIENAGEIEHLARRKLETHAVSRDYFKDGFGQQAVELLACSYTQAREALDAVIDGRDIFAFDRESGTKPYKFEYGTQDI
jgi:hypothetical protein